MLKLYEIKVKIFIAVRRRISKEGVVNNEIKRKKDIVKWKGKNE